MIHYQINLLFTYESYCITLRNFDVRVWYSYYFFWAQPIRPQSLCVFSSKKTRLSSHIVCIRFSKVPKNLWLPICWAMPNRIFDAIWNGELKFMRHFNSNLSEHVCTNESCFKDSLCFKRIYHDPTHSFEFSNDCTAG